MIPIATVAKVYPDYRPQFRRRSTSRSYCRRPVHGIRRATMQRYEHCRNGAGQQRPASRWHGDILICPVEAGDSCLDILAVDNGPGIRDVGRAFEDGVSTGGTAGQGLGAVKRLSDTVSLYSVPDSGTVVFCRFGLPGDSENIPVGGISIPIHGEVECGDSYLALPGLIGRSI